MPFSDPEYRRLYGRTYSRVYRARRKAERGQRPVVALASSAGAVSLRKAGIVPGARYIAAPQPGGGILLTPTDFTKDTTP